MPLHLAAESDPPYLRKMVPRRLANGPYVWNNIPLSCVVTDSSALSPRLPTGGRGSLESVLNPASFSEPVLAAGLWLWDSC